MIKYKIDDYKEWRKAYWHNQFTSLEEFRSLKMYKLIFYNKEHYKEYYKELLGPLKNDIRFDGLVKIKTYNDAILNKNSEHEGIREICKHIIKGNIEILNE